jgi:hypothetical protein
LCESAICLAPDAGAGEVDAGGKDGSEGADTGIEAGKPWDGSGDSGCPVDRCGNACVNTSSDPMNCAACGHECSSGSCANGECSKHLVFVSSARIPLSQGLTNFDTQCQNLAKAAGHKGTYLAWISTDSVSPSTRFLKAANRYVRSDGVVVANHWAGLVSGTHLAPISMDEYGNFPTLPLVITSTKVDGTSDGLAFTCANWTSSDTTLKIYVGNTNQSDANWTDQTFTTGCEYSASVYCFEQ